MKLIKRLICLFKGHKWEDNLTFIGGPSPLKKWYFCKDDEYKCQCTRCGKIKKDMPW